MSARCSSSQAHNGVEPVVSVVIPVYNREQTLGRAIQSVFAQTFQGFELIVVDDGSTDNTADVALDFNDPRVRYVRHQQNRGVSAARNTGIQMARGKYVALLDSDDEWLPRKLSHQVEALEQASSDVALVYSGCEVVKGEAAIKSRSPIESGDIYKALVRQNVIFGGGSSCMIRRSSLISVGGFDERLSHSEDFDLWFRLSRRYKVISTANIQVRIHVVGEDRLTADLRGRELAVAVLSEKYRNKIPKSDYRRLLAIRHFRKGLEWLRLGNRERARLNLGKAILACPWKGYAWLYFGLALLRDQDYNWIRTQWRRWSGIRTED